MLCGALVMVVEVLGSRVLGPFFGVSLFVWTSLITVTLVALAAGYAAGGVLSDRRSDPGYLYGIILAAGFCVLAIPLLKGMVLKVCLPLGLRVGALASSLLLFGPALFLLGCVSPYLVRIAAKEMKNIGRTVGIFYALSTVGSFAGTVLTGFVLIAYLGVNRIFEIAGILLICLALGYFGYFRKKFPALAVLIIPFFLVTAEAPVSKVLPGGTRVTKVFSKDSFYGNLKVVDYSAGKTHTRELIIDGLVQGGIDMNDKLSIYEYAYFLEFLPYRKNPAGKNCLVIGLGAGVVPRWYEQQGIRTDVVDIDPEIVEIARNYFGFHISGDIVISDARYFLSAAGNTYDYVVLDVFNGDTTPGHVLSREAMLLIRSRMTPEGVLAVNLIGSLKEKNFMTASVIKTIGSVFPIVELHPIFSQENGEGWGNMVVLAYQSPRNEVSEARNRAFPVHAFAQNGVDQFLEKQFHFPNDVRAVILSDDYNPIDFYDAWLKENVRKSILKDTDWDILL